MIPGIDVSHYQGEIDWQAVKDSGIQFAFVKATDGATSVDPMFSKNVALANAAGVPIGAYHFFRGGPAECWNFTAEERAFRSLLKLPPVIDVELDTISIAQLIDFLREFGKQSLPKAIIYTDRALAGLMGEPLTSLPLWLAEYGVAEPSPAPWSSWTFWQYGAGRVPGISTMVDLDWFNGTADELAAFWTG